MEATSWFGTPVGAVGMVGKRLGIAPSDVGQGGISAARGAKGEGACLSCAGPFPIPLLLFLLPAVFFPLLPLVRPRGLYDRDCDRDCVLG